MKEFLLTHLISFLRIFTSIFATCDLEQHFSGRQMSIEEAAQKFPIVFRGVSVATPKSAINRVGDVVTFTAPFELLNTYKDAPSFWDQWGSSEDIQNRRTNVTITTESSLKCEMGITISQDYIVFGIADAGKVVAKSISKWSDRTDSRVWTMLGWNEWSEWSPCSVSCSSGIQLRTRHCSIRKCPGHNVEQRHCNLFRCDKAINPLVLEEKHFYHPSKDKWKSVPDRTSAWRLEPFTYLWVPSVLLLAGLKITELSRQFSVFITVRLHNDTSGTIFTLRSSTLQDTYLSINLGQIDLKLSHAAKNGSDTLVIPMNLADNHWHQIAISIRDSSVVDCFVDCEWITTDVLKSSTLELPEDLDLIIGYQFSGDLEQLTVVSDPDVLSLHCSTSKTPIFDPSMDIT